MVGLNRHLDELCRRVAEPFYLTGPDLLQGGRATKGATRARRVAMWLAWTTWIPRPSTTELARMFGVRDSGSISQAVGYVEVQIERGTDVGRIAERLRKPASVPPPKLRVIG